MPVTMPVDPIVAMIVLLLVQLPPIVSSASVPVRPTQTLTVPEMAAGKAFMDTSVVAEQPVPNA